MKLGDSSHVNWPFALHLLSIKLLEEKAMPSHSSTIAWKIPWMEEPGRLQSMGSLESDTTERLHFHFSLSCIGGGNSNPLQCSCLEKPRDGGAWWAAVHGVAQSRTQLKRLSSSKLLQNKSVCLSQGPPCLSHHNYSITAIKIILLYTLSICYNGL